ncbi:hypothetical protein BZA05DRAFT_388569, partial [Tricharina praecox]|uniref:uncharacterized protein n=1 Tax=Tricharina praecox TaxID=43433 RepID=UPI0022206035
MLSPLPLPLLSCIVHAHSPLLCSALPLLLLPHTHAVCTVLTDVQKHCTAPACTGLHRTRDSTPFDSLRLPELACSTLPTHILPTVRYLSLPCPVLCCAVMCCAV